MLHLPVQASAAQGALDSSSFFLGLAAGLAIAGLLLLFRKPLAGGAGAVRERARILGEQLTAGAESRYLEAMRERLAELHVGELAAPFEDVYLPPHFESPIPRPSLAHSADSAEPRPISLRQALASAQRLAVLGASGTGRTALLAYLARVFVENEARDKLRLDENRLPVLVHLAEIDWGAQQGQADAAAPLVDAAILHAPRLVAANLVSLLKRRLGGEDLIVLIDGWDEIAPEDRDAALAWLSALVERYPHHRYVIASAPQDTDSLHRAGFACLTIGPLTIRQIQPLADRWVAVAEGGASDVEILVESIRQPPGIAPRPLDFTLALSVWLRRGSMPLNIPNAYDRWIDLALSESGVSDAAAARTVLGRLAWRLFEEDRLITTREETLDMAKETQASPEAGKPSHSPAEIANSLAQGSALFIPLGHGVAFAHRRVAAYLAAEHARDTGQAMALAARLGDPAWDDVTYFFAALGDAAPLVRAALARPDDLFLTTYRRLGHWASIAPPDAEWRKRVMGDLVKPLLSPTTPEPLRNALLRIVVSTRDKGLTFLFKQALGRPELALRRLGLRGFGLMRREADVAHVAPMVNDADASVRAEALRALGEIGRQAAIDALAQALLDLDDDSRRVAAESLAECGTAGWELLKEGASLTDDKGADVMRVRRAVTFGLARVGEDWARDLLVKMERGDKQWFVRSAATDALHIRNEESGEGDAIDLTPLDRDNLGWLVQWTAQKGQPIGIGQSAAQALQRALEEPDVSVRLAAVYTYAHLGDGEIIPELRKRLKDDDSLVRDAAYRALEEIARRTGEVVPQ
ncbi:MAG TPA: HEAT repeat domain-containing protein [Anaerolineae bacterium]|nr:HEAT repeat domain-containing protein [Anaerolineae bacterium]